MDKQNSPESYIPQKKYIISAFIILVLVVASAFMFFSKSSDKTIDKVNPIVTKISESSSNPSSPPVSTSPVASSSQENITAPAEISTAPVPQKPDKMQIIERIAAIYKATHSYTMEGGFVCLDMAIDVWNQLKTNGIEAKIMGGTIQENITAWNYRQLAMEGNHAWVVATVGPNEKVAIETTAGRVIKKGSTDAAPYFKGIAFDDPAQVKRFEQLRKLTAGNCRDANDLANDFNKYINEKQLRPEEIIARKSKYEQRKQDCESAFNQLKEFESKAVFY